MTPKKWRCTVFTIAAPDDASPALHAPAADSAGFDGAEDDAFDEQADRQFAVWMSVF